MGFLGLKRKLDSVVLVLQEYERIKSANDSLDCIVAYKIIDNDVITAIKDRQATTASILVDKLHPTGLVWLIVSNKINDQIACGNHHTYRGILSGNGKALASLFKMAVREMEKMGVHNAIESKNEVEYLEKLIKSTG